MERGVEEVTMDTTPVWVQLPGLNPRLWTAANLNKIASYLGEPVARDHMTGA